MIEVGINPVVVSDCKRKSVCDEQHSCNMNTYLVHQLNGDRSMVVIGSDGLVEMKVLMPTTNNANDNIKER